MPINRKFWMSCLTFLACTLPLSAQAVNVTVTPLVMEINSAMRLGTETRMENLGTEASTFIVEVVKWTQVNGQDVYQPTRDVVVTPARFTVQGKQGQVIRFGLRKKPEGTEISYRVFITEIPEATAPTREIQKDGVTAQLTTALRMSLPLYFTDPAAKSNMNVQLLQDAQGLFVQVSNSGTRREVFRNPEVVYNNQKFKLETRTALAGSTLVYRLPNSLNWKGPVRVNFVQGSENRNVELVLP